MNELYTYPENDYRYYLMHWGRGGESKNHKYISRKKGSGGKWIYTYVKDTVKGAGNRISNAWDRSSLSKTGKKRRENADKVYQNMNTEDERRIDKAIRSISLQNNLGNDKGVERSIDKRNRAWASNDATRAKARKKKLKKILNLHSNSYYKERYEDEDRKKEYKRRGWFGY